MHRALYVAPLYTGPLYIGLLDIGQFVIGSLYIYIGSPIEFSCLPHAERVGGLAVKVSHSSGLANDRSRKNVTW